MSQADVYGRPCDVIHVRTLKVTNVEMGVGFDAITLHHGSYFVFDKHVGDDKWHKHCGPYST